MIFRQLIETKRKGGELTAAEIAGFVDGVVHGTIPDYQTAAFLMAVVWRGMTAGETTELTRAMMESGAMLTLDHLGSPAVDKHSTGGVGDKVSLILGPLAAAAGVAVPMLSGRGLGHTGGTLDKLAAIPGFRTDLTGDEFRQIVAEVGVAMMGQSRGVAPADRKLYALRDVTATVESLPLIVSSILSKKFATGVRRIVFDVKCGDGAFMKTRTEARALARALVQTTRELGGEAVAVMTAMDQPLGATVGNALEMRESIEALGGEVAPDLREVVLALGAEMLVLAGVATALDRARKDLLEVWESRAGLMKLRQLITIQGGDARVVERPELLPRARHVLPVSAPRGGWVIALAAAEVGAAARDLGAGRQTMSDPVDPAVGIVFHRRVGDRASSGDVLAEVHANDSVRAEGIAARVLAAYRLGPRKPAKAELVIARIP